MRLNGGTTRRVTPRGPVRQPEHLRSSELIAFKAKTKGNEGTLEQIENNNVHEAHLRSTEA